MHSIQSVLNAMPHPVFVVDNDVKILAYNQKAENQMTEGFILNRRGGEILNCLHAAGNGEGCGKSPACKKCEIRNSVCQVTQTGELIRKKIKIDSPGTNGNHVPNHLLITVAPFEFSNESYVLMTIEDINDLIELQNFVPICSKCKNIKNENNYWIRLEKFFKDHLNLDFSHGCCPDCRDIMLREMHQSEEETDQLI